MPSVQRSLSLALVFLACAACSPQPPPNVLLVTLDTTRADHIGAYGYSAAHTPTLDRLAAEGVLFEDAITAAPITLPAHSSIMTGLLPPAHGVRDNGAYVLPDAAVTVAERFLAHGYDTAAFVSAIVLSKRYGIGQGFQHYDDELWNEADPKLFMIRERRARHTIDRALSWLDDQAAKPQAPPFFAWVHLFDPHQPYQAPMREMARTASPYDAEISYADGELGRLIDHLRDSGQLDRTLVIVTADHGEGLGEHGERTHAIFIYRSTTHVPLIVRYPPLFGAGQRYAGPVRSIDIAPTLLRVLGDDEVMPTQGRDLLQLLANTGQPEDLPQYSESLVSELGFGMAPLYGVRQHGHSWIRAPKSELYAWRDDPGELTNLYPGAAVVSDDLDAALDELLDDSKSQALATASNPLSKETTEMLQSLGYLQGAADRQGVSGMDPKDGILIYNKLEDARHLAQEQRWPEAETLLREILAEVPGHTSARSILALALMQQERYAQAREEYQALIRADPSQFRLYGMLGLVSLREGDLDGAEQHYQAALAVAPDFVEAVTQLALIATLRDQPDRAQALLEQARQLDPEFPPIFRRLGDLYYDRGDFAAARAQYDEALKRRPDDYRALVQAGNSARRLDDVAAATAYFDRARKADQEHWVASYNLACLHALGGQPDAAWAALDEAIERGFDRPRLLEDDPDWTGLRMDLRYQQRLKRVRAAQAGK